MTKNGSVIFISDAPLELISASSDELYGAIDLDDNRFAFRINNRSLKGFNSALQQEHFYENYMEVDKYKYSTFAGKIIESIIINGDEKQKVRVKGIMSMHGVDQERIINATIQFVDDIIEIESAFEIPLSDFAIRVPSIVHHKIAENINIKVNARLLPKTDE